MSLTAALDALTQEHAELTTRLARVDAAIAALRPLVELAAASDDQPSAPAAPARRGGRPRLAADTDAARLVLGALQAGPMRGPALSQRLLRDGVSASAIPRVLKACLAGGSIVATGATSGRRYALSSAGRARAARTASAAAPEAASDAG